MSTRKDMSLLRQLTSELDRVFDFPAWPALRGTARRTDAWSPEIDVFERDKQLVTKIDLPGMKKEDVKVEVVDGQLTISGERKTEAEEKSDTFYRCERAYGSFFRSVPLPDGVSLDDVKATFADGVLEVSVPLPEPVAAKPRTVKIEDGKQAGKIAAA